MTTTFSLLQEPWIPLIANGGTRAFGSLRDTLLRPAAWQGIGASNPIEALALHRLLLAICHRGIGPGDPEDRADLLEDWPSQRLEDYLDCWAERFDLFHPEHPFLQVPGLAEAGLKPVPWTRLAPARSSGAERILWDRSLDAHPEVITPAQAAVTLVAYLQFTPSGLVRALRSSAEQGPACGLLLTLPTGSTLQETLALSLVPQTEDDHDLDQASWENAALTIEALKTKDSATKPLRGPADRYTWLSRALLLTPGASITHLFCGAGLAPALSSTPDPMSAVVSGKKSSFPLKLREDRAMWRDFHVLTGDRSKGSEPPRVVSAAASIRRSQDDYSPLPLLTGGLLPDQAKIVLWRFEERHVSPKLLAGQGEAVDVANKALEQAESTGNQLRKALFVLCSAWLQNGGERSPAAKDVSALLHSTQAMAHYWAALEPAFWQLVDQLGQGKDGHQALEDWRTTLREVVLRRGWDQAKRSLGDDGRALAAAGRSGKVLGKVFKVIAA